MTLIINGEPRKSRKNKKKLPPVKKPKALEVEYRDSILSLNFLLRRQTDLISEMIADGESAENVLNSVKMRLADANRRYEAAAQQISSASIRKMDQRNKDMLQRSLVRTLGVDSALIIDSPKISELIQVSTAENVSLITSIPEQHFSKVTRAVIDNYRGKPFEEGSLANRLKKIGTISDNRAKFIARDQTASFIGSVNQLRQQDAGIEGYFWRNSKDRRVVGAPGNDAKPNRQHGDHWQREGRFYLWSKPPLDGHPGVPINCRCFAEPVIDMEKINLSAIKLAA